MPIETKATPRATNPTKPNKRGVIAARKFTVPSTGGSLSVPARVRIFFIKNSHDTVKFAFNFNSDPASEHYELSPGEVTPLISITDATTINARGIGGNSEAQAIFMG